jgi:hypothetical protein
VNCVRVALPVPSQRCKHIEDDLHQQASFSLLRCTNF